MMVSIMMFSSSHASDEKMPDVVLKDMYVKIVDVLKKDKDRLASDPEYLKSTLDDLFFPIVHKRKMVALLLGKEYWKTTTREQKKQFADRFFDFLVYKYGSSIALYNGQKLVFMPLDKDNVSEKYADVFAQIIQPGNTSPDQDLIRFSMTKSKKSGWRIFDIQYSSASIVKNFSYTYQSIIAKDGFDALLKKMDEDIASAKQPAS